MANQNPTIRPLSHSACMNLMKNHPEKIIRVQVSTNSEPGNSWAMNPENFGLNPDEVMPLGTGCFDYSTFKTRAFAVESFFLVSTP